MQLTYGLVKEKGERHSEECPILGNLLSEILVRVVFRKKSKSGWGGDFWWLLKNVANIWSGVGKG